MTYKSTIWTKLRENTGLRMKVALALGVGEQAVIRSIERKSDNLTKYAAVQVLSSELGITEEELFESESATA